METDEVMASGKYERIGEAEAFITHKVNGQKIEIKAKDAGKTPQEYVDGMAEMAQELWKKMDIQYDDFIRTTDERHVKVVQKILNNEKPSDEEAGQYLMEELKNKEVGQTTTTKEITIRKEKGKWKVVVDENLQNAIFPGLSEAVNGYGE